MKKDYQIIKNFLENTDDIDYLSQSDAVISVDWREYDDDIVSYFNQKIENKIQVKMQNNGKTYGNDIILNYKEKTLTIPYDEEMDRDTTIIYVNEIVKSDYEIRLCADSIGSDTLGFVILEKTMWQDLETIFGKDKVHFFFEPIFKDKRMFDLSLDEVFSFLDKRRENNF